MTAHLAIDILQYALMLSWVTLRFLLLWDEF